MTPLDALNKFLVETSGRIMEVATEDGHQSDPRRLVFSSLGTGIQFALELAMLDPGLAQRLITDIHEHADDPEGDNYAVLFISLVNDLK